MQRPPDGNFASAWQVPVAAVEHLAGQAGMLQSASNQPLATFDKCSMANGSLGCMNTRHSSAGRSRDLVRALRAGAGVACELLLELGGVFGLHPTAGGVRARTARSAVATATGASAGARERSAAGRVTIAP